jgi:hypothetical protein
VSITRAATVRLDERGVEGNDFRLHHASAKELPDQLLNDPFQRACATPLTKSREYRSPIGWFVFFKIADRAEPLIAP